MIDPGGVPWRRGHFRRGAKFALVLTRLTTLPTGFATFVWGPNETGSLTFGGLLSRESESFGPSFRGAKGTLKVRFEPQKVVLETENFGDVASLA